MSGHRPQVRRAVVSGLGPNGVTAALELLGRGYQVVVVEKRSQFTRPIHLHLRSTYLEEVRRLCPELHRRLMAIATPIVESSRAGPGAGPELSGLRDRRQAPRKGEPCPVWSRLSTPPERHVRLNNAESLYCEHLEELAARPSSPLSLRRGFLLTLQAGEDGYYRVSIQSKTGAPEELGKPDLVVIAEGGKSPSVAMLGLENVRFSYPKYFMSAHVALSLGPRTRRIDTDLRELLSEPGVPAAELSLWASGHGQSEEGTWIVLEVPERLLHQHPEQAEEYFVRGAMMLLRGAVPEMSDSSLRERIQGALPKGALLGRKTHRMPGVEVASKPTFAGTFKFEQQCLRHPAAGKNVVVLGDAAGMGHHALSSGLEMGAIDLGPLGTLCDRLAQGDDPAHCVASYAETVFGLRLRLLALGMNEYYPDAASGRLAMLERAAVLSREDPT